MADPAPRLGVATAPGLREACAAGFVIDQASPRFPDHGRARPVPIRIADRLQEPIAEFFIVIATDGNGCPWLSISGRGLPFAHRDIVSPFPYARLPALAEGAPITAIVQDYKAIRPWIMVASETSFVRDNTMLWVGLGPTAASC